MGSGTRQAIERFAILVLSDDRGAVIRTFRVAGVARPWDDEAQRWYDALNQHLYLHLK